MREQRDKVGLLYDKSIFALEIQEARIEMLRERPIGVCTDGHVSNACASAVIQLCTPSSKMKKISTVLSSKKSG